MGDWPDHGSKLLTLSEHRILMSLGDIARMYEGSVVGNGPTRVQDIAEFCGHIHDLQHAVMAQACARAYPSEYRLAGETLVARDLAKKIAWTWPA